MSVSLSVYLENLYTDFHDIRSCEIFSKHYWRIPILVEVEHKRRPPYVNRDLHMRLYAYAHHYCNSINIYRNEKCFETNLYRTRNSHFLLSTLFSVSLKGLRHNYKGVRATEPFRYAGVSKLAYSTVNSG